MSWPQASVRFSLAVLILSLLGCGVKGDPLPPEKPANLGRGRPTYKRATEGIKIDKSIHDEEEKEDEKDEEEN